MCEFRLVGTTQGKSKVLSSKKYDMTSRVNKKNNVYLNIGKGVELFIKFDLEPADAKRHADIIKRDTQMVDEDLESNASVNPYMETNPDMEVARSYSVHVNHEQIKQLQD